MEWQVAKRRDDIVNRYTRKATGKGYRALEDIRT